MLIELIIKRIEELCTEKGITYYELAKRSNLNHSILYEIVNGKKTNPRISTIAKIIKGLDINLSDFFKKEYFK